MLIVSSSPRPKVVGFEIRSAELVPWPSSESLPALLRPQNLRTAGIAPSPWMELSPIVEEFSAWLRAAHRAAAPGTVANYTRDVQAMVEALGDPRCATPAALRTYLLRAGRARTVVHQEAVRVGPLIPAVPHRDRAVPR